MTKVIACDGYARVYRIAVEGYPSEAITLAHRVATVILGTQGPWHFTSIELTTPMQRGLGDKQDAGWLTVCHAELKR